MAFGFVACLGLVAPVLAGTRGESLASVAISRGEISFEPQLAYSKVRLTLTGPDGFQAIQWFDAAQTVTAQFPPLDGLYKYELRFAPELDEQTREALAAARDKGVEPPDAKAAGAELVQSGTFAVHDGAVVPETREIQEKVVLTNADGVIRNSLCVGLDCPDAPAFGDSTILLMENNTRIKFGDTSVSPFPANDWEIEANSSVSGGASYLGFNDCGTADNDGGCADDLVFAVESGARASALFVESDGDIGIGTSNPVVDVHVITGNTPTLRLDQDGSSGFTAQVWDIAGNEANFFVRDVTGGSTLPFRIQPGAPSSAIFVKANGDVGMGTTSPENALHVVESTGAQATMFHLENNAAVQSEFENNASGVIWRFGMNNNGDFVINDTADLGTAEFQVTTAGVVSVNGGQVHPDYVFAPDYPLMPLQELAAYVAEHRHLPNVQSAVEREQAGNRIILSELPLQILEKVEQLVLYTIEQQKKIDALEARLEAVEGAQSE